MRIALATCRDLPEPDPDQEPLLGALRSLGAQAEMAAWDDPLADFSAFDLCVIRSTWDYIHRLPRFLDWAEQTARKTRLLNPWKIVRWNSDKSYLKDLESRGFKIVPTEFYRPGGLRSLKDILEQRRWSDFVIKPQVGAASFMTRRFKENDLASAELFLKESAAKREMLIQAYVPSVEDHGERSLVWIKGELTHAVRKSPRLAGGSEKVGEAAISPDERSLAASILAPYAKELLYARVDTARDAAGGLLIMELELIEPSLFLLQYRRALELFAGRCVEAARLAPP